MAKNIEDLNRGLKLKAEPKPGALSLRVGTKKYVLPFEVRTVQGDGFLFVHLPPSAGILSLTADGATLVEDMPTAEKALASFRKPRKRTRSKPESVEVPSEFEAALKKIPAGYKPVFEGGKVRLVRTRNRGKK